VASPSTSSGQVPQCVLDEQIQTSSPQLLVSLRTHDRGEQEQGRETYRWSITTPRTEAGRKEDALRFGHGHIECAIHHGPHMQGFLIGKDPDALHRVDRSVN